jgi:hypothetical protein
LPEAAVAHYEALRATVLEGGGRAEGLAVVHFHGMVRGLAILLKTPSAPPMTRPALTDLPVQRDSALVRLLANLVLHTHSELTHVC